MKKLNTISNMPQMNAAFANWMQRITLTKRIQQVGTIGDGLVTFIDQNINFMGTIQPLNPKQIALKPEGQRAWNWLQIHAKAGTLALNTNDQIIYNGIIYKVMALLDYTLNGYIEYHAVTEYQ